MRVLTFTTLYPNAAAPTHGVFVENRLAAFAARHGADVKVVAPVPWFPLAARWAGRYGAYARAPRREARRGLSVSHPRYLIPPKIGMNYAPIALERCLEREARSLIEGGWDFDVIDAHYLYPDCVAALRVGEKLGKPVVVTARGSDVSLLPSFSRQRRMILETTFAADGVVAVADALKTELVRIGAPKEKIRVFRNGVDLKRFRPLDRETIRRKMGLHGRVIASVGHLIERKGHHLVIEALAATPNATLLIVGAGEEEGRLKRLAARVGVSARVRFLGAVAHEALVEIYNAADALALASSREGWPNVLLEAMACGTPVVATPVWGSVEIVCAPEAGRLARDRDAASLADALRRLLAAPPFRAATRRFAENYSWDETSDNLAALFDEVVARRRHAARLTTTPIKTAKSSPKLLVTADTEEIFDWARPDPSGWTVAPVSDIDRLHRLARSFGAKPLYFLTAPVIDHAEAAFYFRALHRKGEADLGLHLHQWTTPPFGEFEHPYYSWQCNLPESVQSAKLRELAACFERAFGFRARAHRAGRYGADPLSCAALAEIGVDLDFSPSPAFDFSKTGGPDFSALSNAPFRIETPNADSVAVTPVSGARAFRGGRLFLASSIAPAGFRRASAGLLRGLTAPMRLSCEGAAFEDLAALTRRLIADGGPVLTFSLHSTSMTPGATPYARDAESVSAMLETARRYFAYFRDELGGEFVTVDDLAGLYGADRLMVNPPLSATA
ncbi:MAG: glycosyltransferase [Alphaproteobacteria bacterium]|nr:glycosyltransferase [Alphaproteobacteria bacterium]